MPRFNIRIHDLRHAGATILDDASRTGSDREQSDRPSLAATRAVPAPRPRSAGVDGQSVCTELFHAKRAQKTGAQLLAHLARGVSLDLVGPSNLLIREGKVAGWTGLEPAASGVTGRRSNQLNYHPNGYFSKVRKSKVRKLKSQFELT
jgi:hypothetical protein